MAGRDIFHPTAPDPQNPYNYRTGPQETCVRRDFPSPVRLWIAQVPSPLWVRIRNSAMTPIYSQGLRDNFNPTAPNPNPQKTIAPDTKKFAQGSPQPGKTMGSPGTSPLWMGVRNSALNLHPPYRAKAGRDIFHTTAPDPENPDNYRTGPQETCAGVSRALSDYG